MPVNNSRRAAFIPFYFALALLTGVFIGTRLGQNPHAGLFQSDQGDKLLRILQIIQNDYVDEVNPDSLNEIAIEALLAELDPHSTYIPPVDLAKVNEDMEGNFDGVGIEFNIQQDTIMVVTVISGGPAEKAGVMPGDRIIQIDREKVAGVKIGNEGTVKRLRGKRGTKVKVGIRRFGVNETLELEITRGKIPLYSLDAAFMLDAQTGYIKISRFSANTHEEYKQAVEKLLGSGMKKFILDLRENPGGYLDQAISLADEFLKNDELIVFTEGRNRKKQTYNATGAGEWENGPLAILIDENSASASEIVAGAVQDQDRGMVVGRRSFGKGLVQEQMELADGSGIRLTVARYYTPSGRCIQRPYKNGTSAYYHDAMERNPEADTTETDTLKYFTKNKRVVYGGGGIRPDITVQSKSERYSDAFFSWFQAGEANRFSFLFSDEQRKLIKSTHAGYRSFAESKSADEQIKHALGIYLKSKKSAESFSDINSLTIIKALIARNIWGNEAYYYQLAKTDPDIDAAQKALNKY
jgi:carboxyl-terminal processing protease